MKKPRGKLGKWILAVLLTLMLLTAGAFFVLFWVNEFTLTIRLTGEEKIDLEYGEHYSEPGAEVSLCGTLFLTDGRMLENAQLHIDSEVDESTVGRYRVSYSASYGRWHAETQRTVRIIDTKEPVIILTEDTEEALMSGTAYQEAGFIATDNYDGDITDRVIRTEAMGQIFYAVTDSSGNPAVAVREIPYHDPCPPQIKLEGGENYSILTGTRYTEPGYTATDNVDGDLTELVAVEGEVDWLTPGVYPVTYTVSDAYENVAAVTRSVSVMAQLRPDTVYPEGKTVYLTFDDGPGAYTERLLDILGKYDVKATFFVTDTGCYEVMKEIVARGHSIGIHSVTHNYEEIYADPEAYFQDLYKMQSVIYENTGVLTTLMRFPGGSSNMVSRRTCEGLMTVLSEAVQDAGFQYFDWNVYSGDAGETQKTAEVVNYVVEGLQQNEVSIVLQHDIHSYSVEAVEDIILWGLNHGYQFLPLTESSPGFHHDLNN